MKQHHIKPYVMNHCFTWCKLTSFIWKKKIKIKKKKNKICLAFLTGVTTLLPLTLNAKYVVVSEVMKPLVCLPDIHCIQLLEKYTKICY